MEIYGNPAYFMEQEWMKCNLNMQIYLKASTKSFPVHEPTCGCALSTKVHEKTNKTERSGWIIAG
jgi:hypothetical protein